VEEVFASSMNDRDLAELIKRYEKIDEAYQIAREARYNLGAEIRMVMNQRGASLFAFENIELKLGLGKAEYNPDKLLPLLEMDQSAELANKARTTVTYEKWDGRVLNKIKQLGDEYTQIVEDATERGLSKIEITRKGIA
jgi:hypothetical protein